MNSAEFNNFLINRNLTFYSMYDFETTMRLADSFKTHLSYFKYAENLNEGYIIMRVTTGDNFTWDCKVYIIF